MSLTSPTAARAQFFAGYLLEQSLSVDNLFVFILIFTYFQTPRLDQDKVRRRRGRHASAPGIEMQVFGIRVMWCSTRTTTSAHMQLQVQDVCSQHNCSGSKGSRQEQEPS